MTFFRRLGFGIAVLAVAVAPFLAFQAKPIPIVSVDVAEIPLDVTVSDAQGRPVLGLGQQDFEVYEDGVSQRIVSFSTTAETQNVLFLVHNSYRDAVLDAERRRNQAAGTVVNDLSLRADVIWNPMATFLQDAAGRLIARLPARAQVSIAVFDFDSQVLLPWRNVQTGTPVSVKLPLPQSSGGGAAKVTGSVVRRARELGFGHDLYGSLIWALNELRVKEGRKTIVVFDDGRDIRLDPIFFENEKGEGVLDPLFGLVNKDEDRELQKTLNAIKEGRTRIHFIAYGTARNSNLLPDYGLSRYLREGYLNPRAAEEYLSRIRARIEQLAEVSGGRVFYPTKSADILQTSDQLGSDLSTFYNLNYVSSNLKKDGNYRRIEVRIRDTNLRAHLSRSGYYAN